jgi:hypothetical protein
MKGNPTSRQSDIVVQELKGEILIYDLKINKAFCLNETSALVYELCDGNNSISDISKQLTKKLKQPVSEDLIWLAIDQLKQDNLLENSPEIETKFEGLSRREVIRKVGIASMIALPVISSLIAPTAAMAQSGVCVNEGGASAGTVVVANFQPDCATCETVVSSGCCSNAVSGFSCGPGVGGSVSCSGTCT